MMPWRTHRIAILWKSGRITRHRTTGLTVSTNPMGDIVGLKSEWVWPRIVDCDVSHVAAVFRGRVRS